MIRFLPFILIPLLILGGLWYWRSSAKPSVTTSETQTEETQPIEVPKTLPNATLDDRVKTLESTLGKLVPQVNNLKSPPPSSSSSSSSDSRVNELEAEVTELKMRVSALEKASPAAPALASQSTVYIPVGSAAGPWTNIDWYTLNEYEVSLDPANYPGYTGMSLEVNFRLVEPSGTGSVRLYNATDGSALSSQVDTTSTDFGLKTSGAFKLANGRKTYKLQMKSSERKELFIQSARIKVNF